MPDKNIPQKDTIKRRTIAYMKELGTYRKEYNQLIEIYADMLKQYYQLTMEFEAGGCQAVVETEKSDGKKNPILASLENLRKDIGTYSDRLMLNAKAFQKEIAEPKKEESMFAKIMSASG